MELSTAAEATWVPVKGCTLPTAEQPLRVAEFDDLFAASLRTVEHRSTTRATLTFTGDETFAGRLQQIADAETACCSFFAFTVTSRNDEVVLDIAVPEPYADVLAALVERAERAVS